ncbi:MAG TPA: M23 family metallopeptidase [Rubrobacter sp.]|nr:M23 family metallopeptidase [Rubrobacter sp.]
MDYSLTLGDVVYSPFRSGTVTFAGQNTTHQDYGVFVYIKADNGKYVNVSAHLSGLASGIEPGATVDCNTIIGFAGDTGGPNISVGQVHLHQAFYRYPDYNPDGSPFGGRGLQAVYFHYIRGEDGIYELGWSHTDTQISKGDNVSY